MLSEKARQDVREKLAQLQQDGPLRDRKCDDVYRALYPDAVSLHAFRSEWQRVVTEEARPAE